MLEATLFTSPDVTRLKIEALRASPRAYVELESIPNVRGDKSFADDLNLNEVL
jgi:hypothetical protein